METKKRIIKVSTSELESAFCYRTYEVILDESMVEEFINNIDGLSEYSNISKELNKHNCKLVSKTNGEQYKTNEFSAFVNKVELLNQLPLSL